MARHGVTIAARKALQQDNRARAKAGHPTGDAATPSVTPPDAGFQIPTGDSFQNFQHKLGIGTDSPLSSGTYGYNPITRIQNLLEWIYRGAWIAGVAVDVVADDMTRAGVELVGSLKPDQIEMINECAVELQVWEKLNETFKWGRLYGGAIGVLLIDGQNPESPLRLETVGKNQFKGILVLDRWMVDPSLNDLVTELGPFMGDPKFYRVLEGGPGLSGKRVHYSRVIRCLGLKLPHRQALTENLWGLSILERLYDRLVSFDSATTGTAQLVFKAYLRTMKIKGMRALVAQGGIAMDSLVRYTDMMRRFQSIEGVTLIDAEDDVDASSYSFSGLDSVLTQLASQVSGALQIPMVRLLGQSPGGLNSSGDSDLRTYYDGVNQQQNKYKVQVTAIYRAMAQSKGIRVKDGFGITFKSLWQLSDKEKAEIAKTTGEAIDTQLDSGLISKQTALKELRQSSHVTGIFTNITDADIAAAEDIPVDPADKAFEQQQQAAAQEAENAEAQEGTTGDAINSTVAMSMLHGLDIGIENKAGTIRRGKTNGNNWEAILPADYGFIRRHTGADGDEIDCFVGPSPSITDDAYIIDQRDLRTGHFDEHKIMLGYPSRELAIADYCRAYSDGLGNDRIGSVSQMNMEQLQYWLKQADLKQPSSGHFKIGKPKK